MKNIGIWLDKKVAKIVTIENDIETLEFIESEVDDYHVVGGSGTRFKGGPQDVVQDSRYLEREKHQLKSYFGEIVDKIKTADEIIIYGPAQTNEKLKKELFENFKFIDSKIREVVKVDSMTDNQLKALVRDSFKSN